MPQAKVLTEKELKIVLAMVAQGRHATRNRALILTSFWTGMRVGEIAAIRVGDVINPDGSIKDEIRLSPEQTKGSKGRVVMLGDKIRKELSAYAASVRTDDHQGPFFYSQRNRDGFTANTMCQHFAVMYKNAGLSGASSHSGRRTFITTLANKGVGVRVLMALAGHQNIGTTQRYIDLNDEMMKIAVGLI